MSNDDWYCCESTGVKPEGFTFHPNVTVCDTCGLKFPYWDCECELIHDCPDTGHLLLPNNNA